MKEPIDNLNATPSKRLYLSIIADYHIELSLCELIDNAIDNWIVMGKTTSLEISIDLDYDRQLIKVQDNAGGIKEEDAHLIVSPGYSRQNGSEEIIGVFGVGSKRAVVALAEEIKIVSRYRNEKTIQVEIDDDWIKDQDNWMLPVFEVDAIDKGTTIIELVKLRDKIIKDNDHQLVNHLSSTYALFLEQENITIYINDEKLNPITFEKWSFPPDFTPCKTSGPIDFGDKGSISLEIIGGLTKSHQDSNSSIDEYGVYFYCNRRLISRAYKGPEVGFKPPRIGNPHTSKALARVIVKLTGPVELMPWNSSKSEIDFKHRVFKEIESHIERMLFSYVSTSKNLSGDWGDKVFKFSTGAIKEEVLSSVSRRVRIHTPTIPRKSKKEKYASILKRKNKDLAKRKPWIVGTYETEVVVGQIVHLKLDQSNRIAMLLLDSSLEIAFKDYLVNDSGETYSESRLASIMRNRTEVHNEIKRLVPVINSENWRKIEHYYRLRCDLVHKRSTVSISEHDLEVFRDVYKLVINQLFNVDFNRPEE